MMLFAFVTLAALAGLPHSRKTATRNGDWPLGMETAEDLLEESAPQQEVSVSDASQLNVAQLTKVSVSDASQLNVAQLTSVTMKPDGALLSLKSSSSLSLKSSSSTAVGREEEMLLGLERSVMALVREGAITPTVRAALGEIAALLDGMRAHIQNISNTSNQEIIDALGRFSTCYSNHSVASSTFGYPQEVCAQEYSQSPSPSASSSPSPALSFLEMGGAVSARRVAQSAALTTTTTPTTALPLYLVQGALSGEATVYLDHVTSVQVDTVLKIRQGTDTEELVKVISVSDTSNSVTLSGSLFFNHIVGEHVAIFAFGGNSEICDVSDYCPSNSTQLNDTSPNSTGVFDFDPVPLRECRARQEAAYATYLLKREKLQPMLELKDFLCAGHLGNASDSLWPDYLKCAMSNTYTTGYGENAIGQFYDDLSKFYGDLYVKLHAARVKCETATWNYRNASDEASAALLYWQSIRHECNKLQVDLDTQVCDDKDQAGQCWIGYETCYHNARSNFYLVFDVANATAHRLMSEMRAVLRIDCLINALNDTGDNATENDSVLGEKDADDKAALENRLAVCGNTSWYNDSRVTSLAVDNYTVPCPGICPNPSTYRPGTKIYADFFYAPYQSLAQDCSVHCCAGGSSTSDLEAIYVLGEYNTHSCPAGSVQITDSSKCQAASAFLASHLVITNATWRGDENVTDWPKYCHQVTELGSPGVWFNNHSSFTTRASARPICEDLYLVGPKVSSSAGNLLCNASIGTLEEAKAACEQLSNCAVLLDAGCDNSQWVYCQTTISEILANNPATDACTMVKVSH